MQVFFRNFKMLNLSNSFLLILGVSGNFPFLQLREKAGPNCYLDRSFMSVKYHSIFYHLQTKGQMPN